MLFRLLHQDIPLIELSSGRLDINWYDRLKQLEQNTCTVATLPPAGNAGARNFVTDATVTTFASVVVGGGANKVPVYDDGSAWRIG